MTLFKTGIPTVDKALADDLRRIRALEATFGGGAINPPPYSTWSIVNDGTNMAQVIIPEPARVFGWSFHNEFDETCYGRLIDSDNVPTYQSGALVTPALPPDATSGHFFNYAGIEFTTGIAFFLTVEYSEIFFPFQSPPPAETSTFELYYLLETEMVQ